MSWFALAPTIVIAVIIAAAALIKPRAAGPINLGQQAGKEASPSGPLPTFAVWLRPLDNARQPVLPIDYSDLTARANRGIKVAGIMVVVALVFTAGGIHDAKWWPVVVVLAAIPFAAIGGLISVIHTVLLRLLPYRGPIVSTALGTLLGSAAAFVLRDSMVPIRPMIVAGLIYGFMTGIVEPSLAGKKVNGLISKED